MKSMRLPLVVIIFTARNEVGARLYFHRRLFTGGGHPTGMHSCYNYFYMPPPSWIRYCCVSVCLPIHPCICVSVCLSVCLSVHPSIYLRVCLSAHPSMYLSVCLSVCTSIVCMSVCPLISLSMCIHQPLCIVPPPSY